MALPWKNFKKFLSLLRETEKERKKKRKFERRCKILNKIPSIFYFLLIIHSLPTHPPKFPFPSILAYRTRDFGFLRRFYERREINFPLSCTPQPRKPRLSFPFGRNLSTLHPLARFFLTSLPSLDPLQSPRRTVFCNRAFRVQCYLYHPRVHSACSVAIATNDKLSHENAPLSLHVLLARKGPPFLSLSRFVHPQRVSISIPESVRAEINYPRIHEDSSLRPMKYSRHDDTARLVSPGQGYKSRGPWVEKKSGLELGNWVVYRYYSSVLLGCNLPSGALVRSFGPGSIQAHWIPIKSRTRG